MNRTIESYLKKNIDSNIEIKPWNNKNEFSVFLRNHYNFYNIIILQEQYVFLEVLGSIVGINELLKHIKIIIDTTGSQVVLYLKNVTRYRRRTLIENKIPFVIDNEQMYLPFLGLDLKQTKEVGEKEIEVFNTSTQVAYLYFLYNKETVINTTEFASKIGVTKMTASRALNNLYGADLISYEIGGKTARSKKYKRISDPNYFIVGREYLKTPVRDIVYTKTKPQGALIAGTQALAELSMLNSSGFEIMAIDRHQINKDNLGIFKNHDYIKDEQLIELQLWDYDPKLFSNHHSVDSASLFASLRGETDERIEQAIEEVLRGEEWYMD